MSNYQIGDEVVCRIDDSDGTRTYTQDVKLQIITDVDEHTLLCYVPQYVNVRTSFKLNKQLQSFHKFDLKFLGEYGAFVNKTYVQKHIPAIPSAECTNCKTLVHWVEQSNEYTCRPCRENPWR